MTEFAKKLNKIRQIDTKIKKNLHNLDKKLLDM